MLISVSEAKGQLSNLVRRAEAGDDVVLTRHGQPKVRLVVVTPTIDRAARQEVFDAVRASPEKATTGPCAARSQDFLYDEFGLPA